MIIKKNYRRGRVFKMVKSWSAAILALAMIFQLATPVLATGSVPEEAESDSQSDQEEAQEQQENQAEEDSSENEQDQDSQTESSESDQESIDQDQTQEPEEPEEQEEQEEPEEPEQADQETNSEEAEQSASQTSDQTENDQTDQESSPEATPDQNSEQKEQKDQTEKAETSSEQDSSQTADADADEQIQAVSEQSEPELEEETTPTGDVWQENSDSSITTLEPVSIDTKYSYKDSGFELEFSHLEQPGKITIREFTPNQDLQALGNKAWEVTSTMPNGSFKYDLKIPYEDADDEDELDVVYSEEEKGDKDYEKNDFERVEQEKEIKKDKKVIKIKGLDHFTIFLITNQEADYTGTPWIEQSDRGFKDGTVHYPEFTDAGETATWEFDSIDAGLYKVYISWTTNQNRPTNSPFTLTDSAGTDYNFFVNQEKLADQSTDGTPGQWSGWFELDQGSGPFSLNDNSKLVLTTVDNSGDDAHVIADEVLLVGVDIDDIPQHYGYNEDNGDDYATPRPDVEIACGGTTNINSVSVHWSDVSAGDSEIKYQRQYMKPGSSSWQGNEIYSSPYTNYKTFSGATGVEGEYKTRVRAFLDADNDNVLDSDEEAATSDWSDECSITYTKNPIVKNLSFEEPDGTVLSCGAASDSENITVNWTGIAGANPIDYYLYSIDYSSDGINFTDHWETTVSDPYLSGSFAPNGEGLRRIRVKAFDSVGNESEWSDYCEISYNKNLDNTGSIHVSSYKCPSSIGASLADPATKNNFKPDDSGNTSQDLNALNCQLEDGYGIGHLGLNVDSPVPTGGESAQRVGSTGDTTTGVLTADLAEGDYIFGEIDSSNVWVDESNVLGFACNGSNPNGYRDNNAELVTISNSGDIYCNLYKKADLQAPVLLGSNAESQSSSYDEGNPSPNTTPNNLDIACSDVSNPFIADSNERYVSNWTEVSGNNVKYIRHNVRPDGSHLLLGQSSRIITVDPNDLSEIARLTDSYQYNHSNGWGTFGGGEGQYTTQVRAFEDANNNNKYDLGETISPWSNTCSSVYDLTAPVVTWVNPLDGDTITDPTTLTATCEGGDTESEYVNFWWYKADEGQTITDANSILPYQYHYVRRNNPNGGSVNGNEFSWQLDVGDESVIQDPYDWDGGWRLRAACKDKAGNYAHSEINITVESTRKLATTWYASMIPNFVTRLSDAGNGAVNMEFHENLNPDVAYYQYQYRSADLNGSNPNFGLVNMNNYPGGVTCNPITHVCYWSPVFNDGKINIHRFRAVYSDNSTSDWSNWNDVSEADFANLNPDDFKYDDFINGTGVFAYASYIPDNGGFGIREQINPTSEITNSTNPLTTSDPTIDLDFNSSDADTRVKNVKLYVSIDGGAYNQVDSMDANTGTFNYNFSSPGSYCFHTRAEDVADDRLLDDATGNIEAAKGCEYQVTYSPQAMQYADVTVCKHDNLGNALTGWEMSLESNQVLAQSIDVGSDGSTTSVNLPAGDYEIRASGTYTFWPEQLPDAGIADAGYSLRPPNHPHSYHGNNHPTWVSGDDLGGGFRYYLKLRINNQNIDWGAYNDSHEYTTNYNHTGGNLDFNILDNGYSDNDGSFQVEIYSLNHDYSGNTEGVEGCVDFVDVPYGSYHLTETIINGWEFIELREDTSFSNGDMVTIDSPNHEFNFVNQEIISSIAPAPVSTGPYYPILEMNYGDRYTDDRDVILDLYPPDDFTPTQVIFSQEYDFSDAQWVPYVASFGGSCEHYHPCGQEHHATYFHLSGDRDENKAVYAKMRNAQGVETEIAINHIILVEEGDDRAENDDNDDDEENASDAASTAAATYYSTAGYSAGTGSGDSSFYDTGDDSGTDTQGSTETDQEFTEETQDQTDEESSDDDQASGADEQELNEKYGQGEEEKTQDNDDNRSLIGSIFWPDTLAGKVFSILIITGALGGLLLLARRKREPEEF
ncbi:MAG: hypothetical protein GF332_03820 [Candidatus Moranbacteria bacterium]|nr:hypothetical protein [Candidatus Moranbacteria bacterium]